MDPERHRQGAAPAFFSSLRYHSSVRLTLVLLFSAAIHGQSIPWATLPSPLTRLLEESGLSSVRYSTWQHHYRTRAASRLEAGSAEHIAYFILQSSRLTTESPLNPIAEARQYLAAIPASERAGFLAGKESTHPLSPSIQRRISAFQGPVRDPRHTLLREMAGKLQWKPERTILATFRFLLNLANTELPDSAYQDRGLSADPFPPSMQAVQRGIAWLRANRPAPRSSILLLGPGAELGSRFGLDDDLPIASPQPAALVQRLSPSPQRFDCSDIRPEVVAAHRNGPCRATVADVVIDRLPPDVYHLAIATNVLVYLNDTELALALANLAQSLAPGGCLIHNDSRFAARLFGDAAGLPALHFESVPIGTRAGRQQLDRAVIHCRP